MSEACDERQRNEPSNGGRAVSERMRELGRRSGEARRRRREQAAQPRSLRDALRERLEANPDAIADRLLASRNAAGIVAALRYIGEAAAEPPPAGPEEPVSVTTFLEVLKVWYQVDPAGIRSALVEAGILEAEPEE